MRDVCLPKSSQEVCDTSRAPQRCLDWPFLTPSTLSSRTWGDSCIYGSSFSTNPTLKKKKKLTRLFSRKQKWCKSRIPESDSKWNCQMIVHGEHIAARHRRRRNHRARGAGRLQRRVPALSGACARESTHTVSLLDRSVIKLMLYHQRSK